MLWLTTIFLMISNKYKENTKYRAQSLVGEDNVYFIDCTVSCWLMWGISKKKKKK